MSLWGTQKAGEVEEPRFLSSAREQAVQTWKLVLGKQSPYGEEYERVKSGRLGLAVT